MNIGTRVANKYLIQKKLGQGGFGAVYLARDTVSGIDVALKTIPREVGRDETELADLKRNFQIIHTLHHPNIAAPLTLEQDATLDAYFLVMEYVEGTTLSEYRKTQEGRKLNFPEAVQICQKIAEALDYAHQHSILHRDIKPQNVMVTVKGEVKVLDFGLASEIRSSMLRMGSGTIQMLVGSRPYMPPEVFRGQPAQPAADQYALGVLFFELVSGRLPFDLPDWEMLRSAVLSEPVATLTELSKQQNTILRRALAKDPNQRYGKMLDFVKTLEDTLTGSIWMSKKMLLAAVLASSLAGYAGYWWNFVRERAPKEVVAELFSKLHQDQSKVRKVGILPDFSGCPEWVYEDYKTALIQHPGLDVKERKELSGVIKDQNIANLFSANIIPEDVKLGLRQSAQAEAVVVGRCVVGKIYLRTIRTEDGSVLGAADAPLSLAGNGKLSIRSTPEGAELRLDGEIIGTTPLENREINERNRLDAERKAIETERQKLEAEKDQEARKNAKRKKQEDDERNRLDAERKAIETERQKLEAEKAQEESNRKAKLEAQKKAEAEYQSQKKAGATLKDPTTGMEFVKIPGGTFKMGCDSWQSNCDSDEKPVHTVRVDNFEIGKYEVTQGQWKAVMGSNPSHFSSCGNDCPVENVSWDDAQDFIKKLNAKGQGTYRLPKEAEWEYACRSGGKAEKYCGGNNVDQVAWYRNNAGKKTHPMGQKSPNGLGIYDMSGNVWEWTCSDYGKYDDGKKNHAKCSSGGSSRVYRGGSWSTSQPTSAPLIATTTSRAFATATWASAFRGLALRTFILLPFYGFFL